MEIINLEVGMNFKVISKRPEHHSWNDDMKEYLSKVLTVSYCYSSGYKSKECNWFFDNEFIDWDETIKINKNIGISKIEEIIPTMQTQLNIIQQIRRAVSGHNVKLEFFQEEFCVSLYDSEIPICWDKQNGLYILTETMSGNIDHEMMVEILSVMDIIKENLDWFKECIQND